MSPGTTSWSRELGRDSGQTETWPSSLRVEFHDQDGRTRLIVREGPHPPAAADLGRQAWEMMLPTLESLLSG